MDCSDIIRRRDILFLLCVMYKMKFNASLSNLGSLPAVTCACLNPSCICRVHNTMYLSLSVSNMVSSEMSKNFEKIPLYTRTTFGQCIWVL